MTTYEPTHGSIVHVELYSEDVDATRAFYGDVFGWTFEDVDGMDYTMFRAPSPPHGGLLAREDGDYRPPPTLVYLNADDLDGTRGAIEDAGGDLTVAEVEVAAEGAFAVFEAPGGVVQAAWEDRSGGEPTEGGRLTDEPALGSLVHVELYSGDPGATRSFYEAVFGWTFEDVGDGAYTIARPPTPPNGGLLPAGDQMPPGTLTYLLVEDVAGTCESVAAAGGDVVREPFDVGGWGTMAVFEAPGGVLQALWESQDG